MSRSTADEFDPPFEVIEPPDATTPLVFNSPHSGSVYPRAFLDASRLDALSLRRSEDCFVDELFASVVRIGAPLMRAHFPRAFLDVNREPYELDPRMFDGRLPPFANTRSMRVAGGLGTIARIVPLAFAAVELLIDLVGEHLRHPRAHDLERGGQAAVPLGEVAGQHHELSVPSCGDEPFTPRVRAAQARRGEREPRAGERWRRHVEGHRDRLVVCEAPRRHRQRDA